MSLADYEAIVQLMKTTPGVSFRDADSRDATERYLERNPGLSFVAEEADEIVGCIMCGHDGRRGYLQHLVVASKHRRRGIARTLIQNCTVELAKIGIAKSHIDVLKTNHEAQHFWESAGWNLRTDIHRYSFISNGNPNA